MGIRNFYTRNRYYLFLLLFVLLVAGFVHLVVYYTAIYNVGASFFWLYTPVIVLIVLVIIKLFKIKNEEENRKY